MILFCLQENSFLRLDDFKFQRYSEGNVSKFSWRDPFVRGARWENNSLQVFVANEFPFFTFWLHWYVRRNATGGINAHFNLESARARASARSAAGILVPWANAQGPAYRWAHPTAVPGETCSCKSAPSILFFMLFSPHASVSMLFLCACEWRLISRFRLCFRFVLGERRHLSQTTNESEPK